MTSINCPNCKTKASVDSAQRKTCVNINCEPHYGRPYMHHEWVRLHNEIKNQLTVAGEVKSLMEGFA